MSPRVELSRKPICLPENLQSAPGMIDLLEMSEAQSNDFQQRLAKSKGAVQIWIHSHFCEFEWESPADKLKDYKQKRSRLIRGSKGMPVVAFIEAPLSTAKMDIQRYARYYKDYSDGDIYYVRTFHGDPAPCFAYDDSYKYTPSVKSNNWQALIDAFSSFGINQAMVSGRNFDRYLYFEAPGRKRLLEEEKELMKANPSAFMENDNIYVPLYCVGEVLKRLALKDIRVFLSNVTFPGAKRTSPKL